MFREELVEGRHRNVEDVGSPSLGGKSQGLFVFQAAAPQEGLEGSLGRVLQPHESLVLPLGVHELRLLEHEPQIWKGELLARDLI